MKHPALLRLRRARTWAVRVLVSFLMLTHFLPPSLQLEFLRWLHEDMDPQHPDLAKLLVELSELEERYAA